MSRKLGLVIVACCLGISSFAHAEICATSSHGISFVGDDYDVNSATSKAISQCMLNPITSNSECSSNLICGPQAWSVYPSRQVSCVTESHGIGFQSIGSYTDVNTVASELLRSCQLSGITSNSECSGNFRCDDSSRVQLPYPSGRAVCETESHGIRFAKSDEAERVGTLSDQVLRDCRLNSVTSNAECSGNLRCRAGRDHGSWNPPSHGGGGHFPGHGGSSREVTCRTSSHGIEFVKTGSREDINAVTAAVLNQCNLNMVTSMAECSANISCR